MRTKAEYDDFMTNVRVSMLSIYKVAQEVAILHLSSKQAAEVATSMDEVAIFLKLKRHENSSDQKEAQPTEESADGVHLGSSDQRKNRGGWLGRLRRMFGGKRV